MPKIDHIRRYLPALLLVLLTLIILRQLLFSGLILARGDTFHYFYPYWTARNAAFAAGQLPLWTPDIFMGAPLLANPQIGTFYPPNIALTPFDAPTGIAWSIAGHVLWAAVGAFWLARRTLHIGIPAALISGMIYGAGGFVLAHAEQINQIQGVAWMPWLFVLLTGAVTGRRRGLWIIGLAVALAMQLFTGHTQTIFISGVGLGLYAIGLGVTVTENRVQRSMLALGLLTVAVILAAVLAVPQLLPTLEITGMSNRADFNVQQATAFSLPPSYLPRALLPNYDGHLFTEYIGYIGVTGLLLMLAGLVISTGTPDKRWRLIWLMIALVGLSFALGRYNPLYLLLANLPGFSLFRVPARWLILFALGGAMLAGVGAHNLRGRVSLPQWALIVAPVIALIAGAHLMTIDAVDIVGSVTPSTTALMFWGGAMIAVIALKRWPVMLTAVVALELVIASGTLPINTLVLRDVYTQARFTGNQLSVLQERELPAGRLLAISGLQFDVGDLRWHNARYDRLSIGEQGRLVAFTALKKQELLFPNLPLTWGLASVDGFGGGVLPTTYFTQFTSLFLPAGELRAVDGRLSEVLARGDCRGGCIPPENWLDRMDVRYLLTDKVFDIWHDDINYDTTFYAQLTAGEQRAYAGQGFAGDTLDVIYSGDSPPTLSPSAPDVTQTELPDGRIRARYTYDTIFLPEQVTITAQDDMTLFAVTHIDGRVGVFVPLQPVGWERVLSSDIKLYERTGQRVRLVRDSVTAPLVILPDDWDGSEAALVTLRDEPTATVIHGEADLLTGEITSDDYAEITVYEANHVQVTVNATQPAYLVVSDAWYPGWQATINGEPAPVYRADVMFRAVTVPAGDSVVDLTFRSTLWEASLIIGGIVWGILLIVSGWLLKKPRAGSTLETIE